MSFDQLIQKANEIENELNLFILHNQVKTRKYINSVGIKEQKKVLERLPGSVLVNLVCLMQPDRARRFLRRSHERVRCLTEINEGQRLLIVREGSESTNSEALGELKYWQEVEMRSSLDGVLRCTVMTEENGKLPEHYPNDMTECADCGKGYKKWQDVWLAECQIHSYHDKCRIGKKECPICGVRYDDSNGESDNELSNELDQDADQDLKLERAAAKIEMLAERNNVKLEN